MNRHAIIRYALAVTGLVLFVIIIWDLMSLIESRAGETAWAARRHESITSLVVQAEKFSNQLDILSPKSAGEDIHSGPRVTEQWLTTLRALRDSSSPERAPLLDKAIEQLAETDRQCQQMASSSVGGKQYAVDIVDVRANAAAYLTLLEDAQLIFAQEQVDRQHAARDSRHGILSIASWLAGFYLILMVALRYWELRSRSRKVVEVLSDLELEAFGEDAGLIKLKQHTPEELNRLARAMAQSFKEIKLGVRERAAELEQQTQHLEREVAVRRMAEEQLRYAAFHDHLTGLCNRDLLLDRLDRCTDRARRHEDYEFAVLFLDIDRFKEVNDSLGHTLGDQLLTDVAKRLENALRSTDTLARSECNTIARIGGDEFVILIDGLKAPSDASLVAERLQEILSEPFHLESHEVFITASIGIATSDLEYVSSEDLLRDADVAMYHAKDSGRARHEVFNSRMHENAIRRLDLANDFRRAIENLDFHVYYQPIVSLQTMRVCGFEALVRWQHPERGIVSPHEFISHAEETGLIIKLGQWMLEQSCLQLKQWRDELDLDDDFSVSVNVSKRQLIDPNLYDCVKKALDDSNLPGKCLKLEITESAVMTSQELMADVLHGLKNLGVEIHMDDFGTGYSSLSQLHLFPLDLLKIDREFMITLSGSHEYTGIVQTIVMLAHHMKMKVTVEGVENAEQLKQLKTIGCDHIQGFYFSKPVDAETARKMIGVDFSDRKSAAA